MGDYAGRSFLQRALPMIFKESDFTKAYLSVFSDSDGKLGILSSDFNPPIYSQINSCFFILTRIFLGKVIQSLKMTKEERVLWLKMWLEIDVDGNNKMSYEEYLDFLYMTDNVYIKRSFDVMNSSFTGVVTFLELLVFASKYLYVDKESTIELCFRLISRRGSLFNPKISILDVDDFKEFIRVQYDNKNLTKAKKRAMNIFTYIDADGDGGLDIQEFSKFCDINPVFVRFTHTIQQHLRKVMFGIAYWVEKTRVIKYSLATGFAALTTLSMINNETEKWTVDMLKQPVIDASSRPLRIAQYKPPPPSKEILDKEEDAVALAEAATALKAASRVNVAWKGPFNMNLLKKNKYEDDFSEVEIRSKERKAAKDKKRRDELKRLNILTSKTQDKMVQAINDLLTGRRALRIAYSTWLNVVGLESKTGNIMPNASENDDGDTAATDETNIDIHEKILKMERDLKADQTKESLTMDYIREYTRNKADKHVLLEACKDRVLHLPDSIANIRSIYNILPPAGKSRPNSKK